jgi:ribonuclease E
MLETELNDRENSSENNGSTDPAGVAPAGTEFPAGNGPQSGAAAPASPETGAQRAADAESAAAPAARKATRTRRAVTRAAGPPAAEPATSAGPPAAETAAPAAAIAVPPAVAQASNAAAGLPAAAQPPSAAAGPPPVTQVPIAAVAGEPAVASAGRRGAVPAAMAPSIAVPVTAAPTTTAAPAAVPAATFQPPPVIFQPPAAGEPAGGDRQRDDSDGGEPDGPARDRAGSSRRRTTRGKGDAGGEGQPAPAADAPPPDHQAAGPAPAAADDQDAETDASGRRRRRRGGRSRTRGDGDTPGADDAAADGGSADDGPARGGRQRPAESDARSDGGADGDADMDGDGQDGDDGPGGTRRRRRKRRRGSSADADQPTPDDPPNTVVHVRPPRQHGPDDSGPSNDVQSVRGSTRLEAKRQRRREGRESGRRRPPVITESEFLARREAVDRVMVVRQRGERTQIAVLEDGVLVEHYVDKSSHQSFVGNVYLGKVQNVLPSMEAAFVDIGKGRNAVLYAGEVNFDASGLEGESKRIESALKSGQSVLVQVTKDPVGHKGARLTSQVSLPGRYLVYVPGASMMGISRKLPDKERTRLKQILKQVMPDGAGVIVRTAAEGAAEEELAHDVARLSAQWESIERKAKTASAPELLYSEPDLTIRVVRDIFNEDFSKLVVAGDEGWDMVDEYVRYVAPHLTDRLVRASDDEDAFARYRIDEQLAKALERKVWLPSGGSLVIDNTEAMTVVDVNTGKFTGKGGNLEETVTKNNLEAAEEMVRQLRLRDIGGIIVIDFIDMVLESNRDLVLRRLLECLARDRTKHQVAEVTSLGLVQMTRKRVGSGLLEAFSEPCECCNGRGRIVSLELTEHAPEGQRGRGAKPDGRQPREGRQSRGNRPERNGKAPERDTAEPATAELATAELDAAGPETGGPETGGPTAVVEIDVAELVVPVPDGPAVDGAGASPGGRRRRRSASREQGPPDPLVSDQSSSAEASSAEASADQASVGQAAADQVFPGGLAADQPEAAAGSAGPDPLAPVPPDEGEAAPEPGGESAAG